VARTASSAVHLVVRQLTRIVGTDVVDDAIAFFRAFDGMEYGFEQRANDVLELLRSDAAAFLLVASPRADTVDEAQHFAARLRDAAISVRGVVVNRATPRFGDPQSEPDDSPAAEALRDFRALARREQVQIDALRSLAPEAALAVVPLLDEDVRDLPGLRLVGRHLAGWVEVEGRG
jgi:anion-transporting  ArsA/GET3 family ATPase